MYVRISYSVTKPIKSVRFFYAMIEKFCKPCRSEEQSYLMIPTLYATLTPLLVPVKDRGFLRNVSIRLVATIVIAT